MSSTAIVPSGKKIGLHKLLPEERIFVLTYIDNGGNVTASTRAAWPKNKNPACYGQAVIKRPRVKWYLGQILQIKMQESGLSPERILRHLETALFLDPAQVFEDGDVAGVYQVKSLDDIPPHIRQCITKIKTRTRYLEDGDTEVITEVEFMSKDHALELAMKYTGLIKAAGISINLSAPRMDFDSLCNPPAVVEQDPVEARIAGPVVETPLEEKKDGKGEDRKVQT